MNFKIRDAVPQDADAIQLLYMELVSAPHKRDRRLLPPPMEASQHKESHR